MVGSEKKASSIAILSAPAPGEAPGLAFAASPQKWEPVSQRRIWLVCYHFPNFNGRYFKTNPGM